MTVKLLVAWLTLLNCPVLGKPVKDAESTKLEEKQQRSLEMPCFNYSWDAPVCEEVAKKTQIRGNLYPLRLHELSCKDLEKKCGLKVEYRKHQGKGGITSNHLWIKDIKSITVKGYCAVKLKGDRRRSKHLPWSNLAQSKVEITVKISTSTGDQRRTQIIFL